MENVIYFRRHRKYYDGLAEILAKTLGLRDPNLPVHSLSVANFAVKLARRINLPEQQVSLIRRGSLLHDIGKLGVSQEILSKKEPLTVEEYKTVKSHPALGAALLQECLEYQGLIPIVRHHHEYYNGQGYPDNIAGTQIKVEARIVSVAEVITTMLEGGSYRDASTPKKVIDEVQRFRGSQFDPNVADAAVEILKEIDPEKPQDQA